MAIRFDDDHNMENGEATLPRTLRALVVDDDTALCEEICEALTDANITAIPASSFAEALEILERDSAINVVISDYFINEERSNGMQLIDCCRTRFPGRFFRFGLMSGDRFVLMEHWSDTSVLKFLKPLVPPTFIAQIRLHQASTYQFELRA